MTAKNLRGRIIEILSFSPKTIHDLLQLLQVPERTLRYHVAILRKQNLIEERFLFGDRRRKLLAIPKKMKKIKNLLAGPVKDIILGMPIIKGVNSNPLKPFQGDDSGKLQEFSFNRCNR